MLAPNVGVLLRSAASPDLYLNNAFRLAGLTVDASTRDLRRRSAELRASRTLGGAPTSHGPLPVVPAADPETVEQALARLRDPLARLVDEFFWFWPAAGDDPALTALTSGDVAAAERRWEAVVSRRGPRTEESDRAEHNLAVLNHALALDDERAGRTNVTAGAPPRWRKAYRHWIAVWRSDGSWRLFTQRVERLRHPGLGPQTSQAFRDQLPLVLAAINASLAAHGLERGLDEETTQVHWRMVGHQDLPPGARARAVRAATDPIVARIDIHRDRAAAVARDSPRSAPAAARQLHEQTRPLLRMLLQAKAPDADGASDTVARQLLACAYDYHKETSDLTETLAILRLAQEIARGRTVRQLVREQVLGVELLIASEADRAAQEQRLLQEQREAEQRIRREQGDREQQERRERMRRDAIEAYERRKAQEEGR